MWQHGRVLNIPPRMKRITNVMYNVHIEFTLSILKFVLHVHLRHYILYNASHHTGGISW